MQIQLKRFLQHKAGLGHCALKGIHQEDHAVHHFEDPFHFSAEVRMARRIYDIDLDSFVMDCRILGQDGDSALSFDIVGIHHTLHDFLIFTKDAALPQKLVHQRGLAMVNMGNNGNIPDVFPFDLHLLFTLLS